MSHSVTLELPDPLYQKLKVRSQQANRSVEDELLTAFAVALPVPPSSETAAVRAYEEVMDFLINGPSPIQIVQFRLSDEIIQHVQLLLDKEREAPLSDVDAKDLDARGALGDFLGILRAKAQLKLQTRTNE